MLQAIVVDDEPLALAVIKGLTEKVTFVKLSAYFTDSFKALEFLQTNKVDLIFLNIKMPDISGIEFLKSISNELSVAETVSLTGISISSVKRYRKQIETLTEKF